MIFEKTLAVVAAAAAIAAATAVSVVAAAFALYALLLPHLGPAGAAAVLALVFAALAALGGILAARKADSRHQHDHASDSGLIAKLMDVAKEKPLLAAGLAVGAGIFALRNPAVLTAVISAFMAGSSQPPPKR